MQKLKMLLNAVGLVFRAVIFLTLSCSLSLVEKEIQEGIEIYQIYKSIVCKIKQTGRGNMHPSNNAMDLFVLIVSVILNL